MKNSKKSVADVVNSIRKEWAFNPTTRIVKSKKLYNRKDKSWKKDIE